MKIEWSALAIERVSEIAEYIAADKPKAAEKWACSIFDSVAVLADFPELGRVVPEICDNRFREMIKGNYRIIYKFEDDIVSILTVRHGRQLLPLEDIQQ